MSNSLVPKILFIVFCSVSLIFANIAYAASPSQSLEKSNEINYKSGDVIQYRASRLHLQTDEDIFNSQIEDLASIYSISKEEAKIGYELNLDYRSYVESLRSLYPKFFIEEVWHGGGSDSYGEIAIKKSIDAKSLSKIEDSRIEKCPHCKIVLKESITREESEKILQQILGLDSLYGLGLYVTVDLFGDVITITYDDQSTSGKGKEDLKQQVVKELNVQAKKSGTSSSLEQISIVVNPIKDLQSPDLQFAGGESYGKCTGAFTVRNGNVFGISTARHCPNQTVYDGANLNYGGEQLYQDVRWNWARTGTPSNWFKTSWTTAVQNSGKGVVGLGDTVWKYGRVSGRTSGIVAANNFTWRDPSNYNIYANLQCTGTLISMKGDSGGPWYVGSKAVGIHSGTYDPFPPNLSSCFTPIQAVLNAGVQLYTR